MKIGIFNILSDTIAGFTPHDNCNVIQTAFTNTPKAIQKGYQNTLVIYIEDIWRKIELFYLFGNHTNSDNDHLFCWINLSTQQPLVMANGESLTYTALQELLGYGSTYINSQFNLSIDVTNITSYDSCVSLNIRTDQAESSSWTAFECAVSNDDLRAWIRYTGGSNSFYWRPFINSNVSTTGNSSTKGYYSFNINGNSQKVFNNGSTFATGSLTPGILSNAEMYILSCNIGGPGCINTNEVSNLILSTKITDAEITTLNTGIEKYMYPNGKGVQT